MHSSCMNQQYRTQSGPIFLHRPETIWTYKHGDPLASFSGITNLCQTLRLSVLTSVLVLQLSPPLLSLVHPRFSTLR